MIAAAAALANYHGDIGSICKPRVKRLNVSGIILPIAVKNRDNGRRCCHYASSNRRTLTTGSLVRFYSEFFAILKQFREFRCRSIGARVIDNDHFITYPVGEGESDFVD
jgi:hypothetical protein